MKNIDKKGFTLIELLAVILIIGVIASIAVISVDKTLKNSKNSLSKVQIKTIEEAAEAYYIKEGMQENKNCVDVEDLIDKGYIEENEVIDPKTKKAMEGSVEIIYGSNQYSYKYNEGKCSLGWICFSSSSLSLGNKYNCKVSNSEQYAFYVLSIDDDNVSLIMDRNIDNESVQWCKSGNDISCNADGAKEKLSMSTSSWSNLKRNMITLPTYEQVNKIMQEFQELPTWMYENLSTPIAGEQMTLPYGYWIANTNDSSTIWNVTIGKLVGSSSTSMDSIGIGVRPVITLSKDSVVRLGQQIFPTESIIQ